MKKNILLVGKNCLLMLFVVTMLSAAIPVTAQSQSNTISLVTAERWRSHWVDFIYQLQSKDSARRKAVTDSLLNLQAFFIPLDDIIDFIAEMKELDSLNLHPTGVRFYMAYGEQEGRPTPEMKLIMVGVDSLGDVVPNRNRTIGGLRDDLIYDLSSPCPNTCDLNSPLYVNNKRKPVRKR
jgi:hypothetical protein